MAGSAGRSSAACRSAWAVATRWRRSTRSIDQFLVGSLGFPELLADTPGDYVALARALGTDPARRHDLSRRLREAARTPPFVNNPAHSRAIEATLETLIHAHQG